jgi:hypothetical protein
LLLFFKYISKLMRFFCVLISRGKFYSLRNKREHPLFL